MFGDRADLINEDQTLQPQNFIFSLQATNVKIQKPWGLLLFCKLWVEGSLGEDEELILHLVHYVIGYSLYFFTKYIDPGHPLLCLPMCI